MPFRMSHSSCTKARKRKPGKTDFTLTQVLTIACEIVQISAGDHGSISDQPFSIKNLYFLSKL